MRKHSYLFVYDDGEDGPKPTIITGCLKNRVLEIINTFNDRDCFVSAVIPLTLDQVDPTENYQVWVGDVWYSIRNIDKCPAECYLNGDQ
jgi:hypothetical protein